MQKINYKSINQEFMNTYRRSWIGGSDYAEGQVNGMITIMLKVGYTWKQIEELITKVRG